MSWDHERVEELLAGHVLGALDTEDAELAERALVEHVPGCERCASALHDLRSIAGDLALAAPAVAPSPALEGRLRATIEGVPLRRRTPWLVGAAAAAAVAVAGLSGWNVTLAGRLSEAETRQAWLADAVSAFGHPDAEVLQLEGSSRARINVWFVRGEQRMYLVASNMEHPGEDVYKVWVVDGDTAHGEGSFVPEDGVGMVPVNVGPSEVDLVMVTREAVSDGPTPTASPIASATFAPAG